MTRCTPWSPEEIAILRDAYASGAGLSAACANLPGRSRQSIEAKAERLDLFRRHRQNRTWSRDELRILSETYPRGGADAARHALPHRTRAAVSKAAQKYGIALGVPTPLYVERVTNGRYACDQNDCVRSYVHSKELSRHQREAHGIIVSRSMRRKERRDAANARERQGIERVRQLAVRGGNVDSAGFFARYYSAMFGGRRAA